ncbi:hypothetical protein V2O64_00975 [Verrucomicrobiaceae bacterium 227]
MQVSTIKLQRGETPFDSLNEMREAHLSLLEKQGEHAEGLAEKTLGFVPDIETFLRRGVGLGRSLDAPDLRSEAQNMLDYWVSTLSLRQRGVSEDDARTFSAAILERFDSSLLESTIEQAGKVLRSFPPEKQQHAKKILMRLAPMSAHGDTFDLASVRTEDLTGGDPEQLALIEELEKTGILQRIETGSGGKVAWRIIHSSIVHRWPEFAEWTTARRRFRQSAKIWDEATRAESSLPRSSGSLEEPLAYRDLNALESDYLEAANTVVRKTERQKRLAIQSALGVLITGLCIVAILGTLWIFARKDIVNLIHETDIELKGKDTELIQKTSEINEIKKTTELTDNNKISDREFELRAENQKLRETLAAIEDAYSKSENEREIVEQQLNAIENDTTPAQVSESVNKIRSALNDPGRMVIQNQLKEYVQGADFDGMRPMQSTNTNVAQALDKPQTETLSPGVRVGSDHGGKQDDTFGSAGIFLEDQAGNIFLASPAYVIGDTKGQAVRLNGKSIARIEGLIGNSETPATRIALARLKPGLKAENILPSVGSISGWISKPAAGTEIILIGQGSGLRAGKVLRIEQEGNIITTRISQPGDGGAPVVTTDGKLIGILLQSREDESVVSPASQLLENTGYSLIQSAFPETGLGGVLAQLIVPIADEKYEQFGKELIKKMEKLGVFIPDGIPLRRANTPEQTDIRYFDPDDQPIAAEIELNLRAIGFENIKTYDNSSSIKEGEAPPPRKFIQIAFNKEELDKIIGP